jgi:gamma-glutamyltranspeptidase / glutathione hydrolase
LLSSIFLAYGFASSAWAHPAPSHDQELGAVASESSVCSNIGIDILKEGGNAADAVSLIIHHEKQILTQCS